MAASLPPDVFSSAKVLTGVSRTVETRTLTMLSAQVYASNVDSGVCWQEIDLKLSQSSAYQGSRKNVNGLT